MRRTITLWMTVWGCLSLGCGGGAAPAGSHVDRAILDDVPELRGAYASGGGQVAPGGAARASGGSVPAGFDGTETFEGRFGGPSAASELSPDCRGWVASSPNHQLYVQAEVPFLQFVVNANPHDTTLVVELADGSFLCNDDTHGLNPAVRVSPMPAGSVRVWVGSFSEGEEGDYRMAVTTDRRVDASAVGSRTGQ